MTKPHVTKKLLHRWVIVDGRCFFGDMLVFLRPNNKRYEPELNAVMIELSEHYHAETFI